MTDKVDKVGKTKTAETQLPTKVESRTPGEEMKAGRTTAPARSEVNRDSHRNTL